MELEDLPLKALHQSSLVGHKQSSSSWKQQDVLDSRGDCNVITTSDSRDRSGLPRTSTQKERPDPIQSPPLARPRSRPPTGRSRIESFKHWWLHNINLTLSQKSGVSQAGHDPRDHHALERTFLAYIRTSNAFVSLGILVAQVFLLSDTNRTAGVVLASFVLVIAILVTLLACGRFFYQQKLLLRGKATTGGWDIVLMWASTVALCMGLFVVVFLSP